MKKNPKVVAAAAATGRVARVEAKALKLGQDPQERFEQDIENLLVAVSKTMNAYDRPRHGLYRPTLRRALS